MFSIGHGSTVAPLICPTTDGRLPQRSRSGHRDRTAWRRRVAGPYRHGAIIEQISTLEEACAADAVM
jgi:hypothetical protein